MGMWDPMNSEYYRIGVAHVHIEYYRIGAAHLHIQYYRISLGHVHIEYYRIGICHVRPATPARKIAYSLRVWGILHLQVTVRSQTLHS